MGTCATYDSYLHVDLDEVEYFNRVLTQSEIMAIVQAGIGGKCKQP